MKTKFTLLAVLTALINFVSAQQIPNGGFETWTSPGVAQNWGTIESVFAGQVTGFTFQDSIDKVQGTSSVKLVTDTVVGQPQAGIVPAFISTGSANYSPPQIGFTPLPFTGRPDTLFFSYKYTSPGA